MNGKYPKDGCVQPSWEYKLAKTRPEQCLREGKINQLEYEDLLLAFDKKYNK